MCTMIVYRKKDSYVGRNLDLDAPFGEKVVITPREYPFALRCGEDFKTRYAMIGMAATAGDYPLYAEAANEAGLAAAGLNFPGSAVYNPAREGMMNITPFELIPWLLGQASSVDEAEKLLRKVNLLNVAFAPQMPLAPLHFMLADGRRSIVAEPVETGLEIYEDPYDVMTNNPPFPFHDWNMRSYRGLRTANGEQGFALPSGAELTPYAEGLGGIGLPGDLSSASRFVRAAFTLANATGGDTGQENVLQTFHVLDSVAMTRGTVVTAAGEPDITRYSCCIDLGTGAYYYKTYRNSRITKISLDERAKSSGSLTIFKLRSEPDFFLEN